MILRFPLEGLLEAPQVFSPKERTRLGHIIDRLKPPNNAEYTSQQGLAASVFIFQQAKLSLNKQQLYIYILLYAL